MSSVTLSFRIGTDSDEKWNQIQAAGTGAVISESTQPVSDSEDINTTEFVYANQAEVLDASPDRVDDRSVWAASFPRLKRQGITRVAAADLTNLSAPTSTTSLLLDLIACGVDFEIGTDPAIGFDIEKGTIPLADDGGAFDASISHQFREIAHGPLLAGLLLANGEDDASHRVSQASEGDADYDYWHGLMHRREPDYGNASYWFRRVGHHPAFDDLPDLLEAKLPQAGFDHVDLNDLVPWDPFAMIDRCRKASHGSNSEQLVLAIQQIEYAHLIEYHA